ncbi:MAG: leucine-rich repeat domain-containing protein, partial [Bacteroidetes bacterium]
GVSPEGTLYFRVETVRSLEAIDNEGDTLRSMLPRIFEINSDPQGNLKIASIYTTGLGEDEAIINWWNGMPLVWKRFLGSYVQVKDSMTMADVLDLADSARIGEVLHYEIRDAVYIDDSLMLRLFGDANGELSIGDSAYIFHTDTLDLSGARLMPGLRRLLALQSLDLSAQSNLWDLEPLSRLNSLRELTLYGESISDLTPLRNLTRLERLNISHTRVESLAPLQYAIFLRELNCKNTPLADIDVFSRFRQLQSVDISSTQVSDLRPLASLAQLRELRIRQIPASDLAPLARLTRLELLDVSASGVTDLGPVSGLSQLQALYAEQTSISDLQPLQSLSALRVIYLEGSKVSDLAPIGRLQALKYIYCDHTPVTPAEAVRFIRLRPDVQVVYESDLLQQWWAGLPPTWKNCFQSKSQIKARPSSEDLHRLASLPQLDIQGLLGVSSLEPLRVFARLESLNVSGIPVSDLTPLSGLLGLEKLNISQTNVTSAAPLRFLLNLTEIDASGTAISDLTPLSDLRKLRRVSLDNTPVQNILPLGASDGLAFLYCDNTRVGDSAAGALLDKLPSLLICYQTSALEAWWATNDKAWRDLLASITGAVGEKPSREALHRILLLPEIQVGA